MQFHTEKSHSNFINDSFLLKTSLKIQPKYNNSTSMVCFFCMPFSGPLFKGGNPEVTAKENDESMNQLH